jgi:hypothetical protein
LIATLNMRDGVTFHAGVDLKKAAPLESAPNAVVRSPLSERSRILAIMSYGHHPPFIAAASAGDLERMP